VGPLPEIYCVAWIGNTVMLLRIWANDLITLIASNQVRACGRVVVDFFETGHLNGLICRAKQKIIKVI